MAAAATIRKAVTTLAALACLSAARLSPAEKKRHDADKVRKHLAAARSHFKLGEFDKAAREWKWAYKLKPIPPLLFDMAQAYRLSGHFEEARFAYKTYLTELPTARNKAEVESQIRTMTRYLHHPPKFLSRTAGSARPPDEP